MRNLYGILEGVLNTDADDFELGLQSLGWRVLQVNYKHGGELLYAIVNNPASVKLAEYWKDRLEHLKTTYTGTGHPTEEFAHLIGACTGGLGYGIDDRGPDDTKFVLDWTKLHALLELIMFEPDWENELRTHLPQGMNIDIKKSKGRIIISMDLKSAHDKYKKSLKITILRK